MRLSILKIQTGDLGKLAAATPSKSQVNHNEVHNKSASVPSSRPICFTGERFSANCVGQKGKLS